MNTALLLIATGEKYWKYAEPLIESARKFFVPHETILFTDCPDSLGADFHAYQKNSGFPETTLKRYHTFLGLRDFLERDFSNLFYVDIDALFVQPVGEEIFSNGITATLHQNQNPYDLLEERPESTAYLKTVKEYYCGGFNGGTSTAFLDMARAIQAAVDKDAENGLIARWHDESYLNKYLSIHPPAKVLTSDYCYPEPELDKAGSPKIVCLEKSYSSRHPRLQYLS